MLRKPRRIPQRFNRPVTPQMRSLVQRRHQRAKQYRTQRWKRAFQKFQRRALALRILLLRYAAISVTSMVLLVAGLLLFSPILVVREIQIRRADPRIDAEQIRQALKPFFGDHLLFITPEQVRHAVEQAVPDIAAVQVDKSYPSTLVLGVTPDPIVARLLIENPDVPAGTGAISGSGAIDAPVTADYLTDQGLYMAYQPNQVRLPTEQAGSGIGVLDLHIVDWGVRPEPGKPLVESGLLLTMQKAERQLQTEFGIQAESRTIYLRAREFHIRVPGYSLWFDLRSPIDEQFGRYRTFLQFIGLKNVKDYIDLRIRNMVVYK